MGTKHCFEMNTLSGRKRLLMVAGTRKDADQRSEILRRNGYDVDCACRSDIALTLSRTHSYDVVLLALECESPQIAAIADEIQKLNPNALVACIADCGKAIPPLPCDRMLWKGEPLEYFLARVNALAATA